MNKVQKELLKRCDFRDYGRARTIETAKRKQAAARNLARFVTGV